MCSRCRKLFKALSAFVVIEMAAAAPAQAVHEPEKSQQQSELESSPTRLLRIAADPNNLPFSNKRLEGFENKIADILADELDAKLEWVWHAQRRGFIRNTLKAGKADITMGAPGGFELARLTKPYYHSTYVFITRVDSGISIASLDDPQLRELTVGIQLIGDDGNNTPPAHALARRNIVNNVRGYTVYGDYAQPNPPTRIIDAVAAGEIDVGIVWGPLAGYFAEQSTVPLELKPVTPVLDEPALPMAYSIAMGIRRGDDELFNLVETALSRRSDDITEILKEYHVPLVPAERVPAMAEEDDDD